MLEIIDAHFKEWKITHKSSEAIFCKIIVLLTETTSTFRDFRHISHMLKIELNRMNNFYAELILGPYYARSSTQSPFRNIFSTLLQKL